MVGQHETKLPTAFLRTASLAGPCALLAVLLTVVVSAKSVTDHPQAADAASIERGKRVFGVNCAFCHGSKANGGEGGPDLLHSPTLLADQKGEAIAVVVLNGRPGKGMPKFELSVSVISDLAAYLHSMHIERVIGAFDPNTILVGDPDAGKAYFFGKGRCNGCHSLQGDLAHIGSKYDPMTLQDNIVTGASVGPFGAKLPTAPPQIVSVSLASGETVKGTLLQIDDFYVTLLDDQGNRRSFLRHGGSPKVEVNNPLQAHLDMLRAWDDRDIHNLTAFLVTQK